MPTTDLNLDTICNQRKRQMLFNVPPIRYNPISPYSGNVYITQSKLDMRRKAEILQYNANKTNTKTNKEILDFFKNYICIYKLSWGKRSNALSKERVQR